MARLPEPRPGEAVLVKKRPVRFSFWPMYKKSRRFGLQSTLFALDPWVIIRDSIRSRCPLSARSEALGYLEQAQDFFASAMIAKVTAARPLLLYYCFLNLAKAFVLTTGAATTLDGAQHGLSEKLNRAKGGKELVDAYLDAYRSPNRKGQHQCFDKLLSAIAGSGLMKAQTSYQLVNLLPQVLPGHRLWASAANQTERFISICDLRFMHDAATKRIWLSIYFFNDDLTRLGVTHKRLLEEARLKALFEEVGCEEQVERRKLICFQQKRPQTYSGRTADAIPAVVVQMRPLLWVTVGSSPPYRRYYCYLAPPGEQGEVLPQILSIYAITYYLGSIVRYRPHHFDKIISDTFGSRIEEFISGQPAQFIYLMASEFARREVTRPSIV